jgi:hypothetical protein
MAALFDWDPAKDAENQRKHGVSFFEAQRAFLDPYRLVARDREHSRNESRFFCFGRVAGHVMTVRFTLRDGRVRRFGAGYRRKGRKIYGQVQGLY